MISLEAREELALGALASDAEDERARLSDTTPIPRAWPETASLAEEARKHVESAPALAAVLAEAHLTGAVRRAREALRRASRTHPVSLRGEPPTPFEGLASAVTTEAVGARREALSGAGDDVARALVPEARDVVDALRGAVDAVGSALVAPLGLGSEGAVTLLDATDDAWRELDARVCASLSLDRARLTWAARGRSVLASAVTTELAPATWRELGSRWIERVGLGYGLRGLSSDLAPASKTAPGVRALVIIPGERAAVVGRPSVAGHGALELSGAVAEALAGVLGRAPGRSERWGVSRDVYALAHALGRGLYLTRAFLQREGGLSPGPRERALVESLHAELARVRLDAAVALFVRDALSRASELAPRLREYTARAVGASPDPAWGPHLVALSLQRRWGAAVVGALAEPMLHGWLRARFDEDWFRNPRAGVGLALALDEVRAKGARAWLDSVGGALDGAALTSRYREALDEARRR